MTANAFTSGTRKAIPAVLIYVRRGNEILMLHRNGKPGDYHSGKWNGLGGKCEAGESVLETAWRELREESGLNLPGEAYLPLGFLQFPNFKADKHEDWLVYVFSVRMEGEHPELLKRGPEGDLHWVAADKVLDLNLWAGDRFFIPLVIAEKPFMGTIWYEGEKVKAHWIQELGAPLKPEQS